MEPVPWYVSINSHGISSSLKRITGKRYNILRSRQDTWDYDIDQLLLGTILFTLIAFLFPTIVTYYAFLATVSSIPLSFVGIC